MGLFEMNAAAEIIHGVAHQDANIIFGTVIDDEMGDEVKVTVIAAGFDRFDGGRVVVAAPSVGQSPTRSPSCSPSRRGRPLDRRRRRLRRPVVPDADAPPPAFDDLVGQPGRGAGAHRRRRVAEAVERAGRDQGLRPRRRSTRRRAAGCTAIGENYAQELVAKRDGGRGDSASTCTSSASCRPTRCASSPASSTCARRVDRPRARCDEIARRAPGARVLVQVDTTGEPGKGGCPLADVAALVDAPRDAGLDVAGLMTVGPTEGGPEAARPGFRAVRALRRPARPATCSMGMSDDLEVAVQEGATQVRVGTALFGPRLSTLAGRPRRS